MRSPTSSTPHDRRTRPSLSPSAQHVCPAEPKASGGARGLADQRLDAAERFGEGEDANATQNVGGVSR